MWIVRVAPDRPYTFVVAALMILITSVVVVARTPTDIFPSIDIPVIAVDWAYTGLNPEVVRRACKLLVKALGGGWMASDLPKLDGLTD